MISALLILAIIILYSFQTLFCRLYNDRYPGDPKVGPYVYCVYYGASVALFTLVISGFHFSPSLPTLLLGILNAVVLFTYNLSLINATSLGSYAVANFCLLSGGILVPLFQSVFFYNKSFTFLQYIGIAVMLAAFLSLNMDSMLTKEKTKSKSGILYAIFCGLLFVANGMYGAILYAQQEVMQSTEKSEMIITTFAVTAVIGMITVLVMRGKEAPALLKQTKSSTPFLILCCLSAASALNLLMYIMSHVNVAILYTVENGGVMLFSTLYAVVLFKEKLTPWKTVGIVLAAVSMALLS